MASLLLRSIIDARAVCMRSRISAIYSLSTRQIGTVPARSILDDDDTSVDLSEDDDLVNGARPGTPPLHKRAPPPTRTPSEWRAHRETMKKQFPEGWSPPRKVSREAMHGLRQLHKLEPEKFTTVVLAENFRISPEAVRRILKSKWEPSKDRREKLVERERAARQESVQLRQLKERREVEPFLLDEKPRKGARRPRNDRLTLQ